LDYSWKLRGPKYNGSCSSGSLFYFARTQAGRADAELLSGAVHQRLDAAQIRIPAPPPDVIGVADYIPVLRPLPQISHFIAI